MAGRFYDDWKVGDRIAHEIRRTVTETDNLLFTTMTHNPQPLHLDVEAAKAGEFGQSAEVLPPALRASWCRAVPRISCP